MSQLAVEEPATVCWNQGSTPPAFDAKAILEVSPRVRETAYVVRDRDRPRFGIGLDGQVREGPGSETGKSYPLSATLPPLYPEWLGDRTFCEVHGVRFPYVTGAMANGIATAQLVIAMARAEMLGFFGAAGLSLDRVSAAIDEIEGAVGGGDLAWGFNLIHSPNEPLLEAGCVDLYLNRRVRRVSASAFLSLTPNVVRYAATGLRRLSSGRIARSNLIFAKISRPEVARQFMSPPERSMLDKLLAEGRLTRAEADLAAQLPISEDIIVEADSGGHTDNRPLPVVLPLVIELRDELALKHGYARPIRVGAAGGLGTPQAVASAFAMGAAFVLTGSVNQAAVESGLSAEGRAMLAEARSEDVIMAAAADMFEQGVKLQVLRRGTMFAVRANKLYELYRTYDSLEALPPDQRKWLETQVLGASVEEVWEQTKRFWGGRDPEQLTRAERDPKHRMALCFRWYLGLSSRWAITGEAFRRVDYQIWCGPAMGAFNAWVKGSYLEPPENRRVVQIARNLMEGAAVVTRAQQLRSFGVAVPSTAFRFTPRPLS